MSLAEEKRHINLTQGKMNWVAHSCSHITHLGNRKYVITGMFIFVQRVCTSHRVQSASWQSFVMLLRVIHGVISTSEVKNRLRTSRMMRRWPWPSGQHCRILPQRLSISMKTENYLTWILHSHFQLIKSVLHGQTLSIFFSYHATNITRRLRY
jgi:hypothetical protein